MSVVIARPLEAVVEVAGPSVVMTSAEGALMVEAAEEVEEVHLLDTLLVCQDRDRAVCQWLEDLPLLVLL